MKVTRPTISQHDFLDYKHALEDVNVVYKSYKKGTWNRLHIVHDRIEKGPVAVFSISIGVEDWLKETEQNDTLKLREKIQTINHMHENMRALQQEPGSGEYVLAADLLNSNLKVMRAWNLLCGQHTCLAGLLIHSPQKKKGDLQPIKMSDCSDSDEKALFDYFDILNRHPELKRSGEWNDHTKGAYEIVYEEKRIREIQEVVYQRFYQQTGSHEFAQQWSRPGVAFEDQYWLLLRDAVISPLGEKLILNRLLWKSQLNGIPGAVLMPILQYPNRESKVSLLLAFRHATQSFEFELPRGVSKNGEKGEETAVRELKEETGYQVGKPQFLGAFPPESESLTSIVPVFSGKVTVEESSKTGKKEAIKGKFEFTIEEIKKALISKDQCLEVVIDNKKRRVPVRDPFLLYALFMSDLL